MWGASSFLFRNVRSSSEPITAVIGKIDYESGCFAWMALRAATIDGALAAGARALRTSSAGKLAARRHGAGLLQFSAIRYLATESDGSTSDSTPPSYELELHELVKQFECLRAKSPLERRAAIDDVVMPAFKQLGRTYIQEELSASSDIKYDEQLLKNVLSEENFNDLLDGGASEYVLRKHLRSVMKGYIRSVNAARTIQIKDKHRFGLQLERLGVSVGFQAETSARSTMLDGNVKLLTAATLTAFLATLATFAYLAK